MTIKKRLAVSNVIMIVVPVIITLIIGLLSIGAVYFSLYHANVLVLKDKSASLVIDYIQHFPANDEFIMDSKGLVRK